MVRENGEWGYINEHGKWAIPPMYDRLFPFNEGVAVVEVKKGLMLIDKNNKHLWKQPYEIVEGCSDGVIVVRRSKWGALDREGNWVFEPKFDHLDSFVNGTARARDGGEWGLVNKRGEWIVPAQYTDVREFCGDRARIRDKYHWGYANEKGLVVIPIKFDVAEDFVNGSAIVKLGPKWGIINIDGNFTAPAKYSELRAQLTNEEEETDL